MKTKLINYRTYTLNEEYIIPIDRRSLFGNPFRVGKDGTRKEVIEKYRKYFYSRLENEWGFKEWVATLKGGTLGCWCTPLPCHGDVIIEYLNGLETEGLE